MTAKGTIAEIVFQNKVNGYTVLHLDTTDGDVLTVVGNLPTVNKGEILEVEGTVSCHTKYGEQLNVECYKISLPTTERGLIKYLSSGMVKGVGAATAKKIFLELGKDALNLIETDPRALTEIKGISEKKAIEISKSIAESKAMQAEILFLQNYNISSHLALKIYNVYKRGTKSIVSQNPYKLIDDVDGIGFLTADKIALNMGHEKCGRFRIRAAFVYCLKESALKEGNTYLQEDRLIEKAEQLLQINLHRTEVAKQVLSEMEIELVIKTFTFLGEKCVSLFKLYRTEQSIATALLKINRDAKRTAIESVESVSHYEKVNNIKLHPMQLAAVKSAVQNGVTVITGGPGTGKTTIIKCIAEVFTQAGLKVELCTPTGRASKRLSESTGREAKTIHRLLGYEFKDSKMAFKYDQNNWLLCDVLIVDEVSMIDITLMLSLLRALRSGARLVLVGDKDQLPSVGAGNVLADIIESEVIDVCYLTHIYRQSQGSLIVSNAHLVNQCKMPIIDNSSKDFFVISQEDFSIVANTVVDLVSARLPNYTGVDSREIQVLGALKSGISGVDNLNLLLQERLNPRKALANELSFGKTIFRIGDRVMQTVNDYNMDFTKVNKDGTTTEGQGVYNGDIGFVKSVDRSAGVLEVLFDDNRLTQYTQADLANLQLAYAITVHKSQGSEFDMVVIPLLNGPPTIINKNLLYTAITRAKKLVVLAGSKKILSHMVRNNYVAIRATLLKTFLKDEQLMFDKFF